MKYTVNILYSFMLLMGSISCSKDPVVSKAATSAAISTNSTNGTNTVSSTGITTVTATGTLTPGPGLNYDYRDQWVGTYYAKFYLVYSTTSVITSNFSTDTTVYDSVKVFHTTPAPVVKIYPFYRLNGATCYKDTATFSVDPSGVYYVNWGGGSVGSVLLDFRTEDSVKYNSNSTYWSGNGNSTYNKTVMSGKK